MVCFPCLLFSGVCNRHPAPSLFTQTLDLQWCSFKYFTFFKWWLKLALNPLGLVKRRDGAIIAPSLLFTVTRTHSENHLLPVRLYLFYFSVFLLGFQKLGEQANISSSFQQSLFVFLFLDKLVNGFLESEGFLRSFSHYLASSGNFLEILSKPKI